MTNYLAEYAYFTNEIDLDKALSEHKQDHWRAMNNTDRDVLDVIRHYSVEFGAAHLKHDTIAAAIGKSNVTVRRVNSETGEAWHYRPCSLHPPSDDRTWCEYLCD